MSVLESFSLKQKVALLVGGSGRFGAQIAEALLQAGAVTYITSRRQENLEQLRLRFRGLGLEPHMVYMDQSVEETTVAVRDLILQQHQRIDILVNNAVSRPISHWNDPTDRFAESMHVNATGIYSVTKIIGNVMERQQSGSMIQVGSIHGMVGPDHSLYEGLDFHGFFPDYFFHKGGMINFTKFVASYYGKSNVRCNCVSPGGLQTSSHSREFVERYSDRTFLRRMANQTDLMGAIVFLASDASAYITGANIPVDGGYTAK